MAENESTEVALTDDPAAAAENNGALAINESAVPARSLAAEKVTDVLPPAAYERIGQFVLSPEAEKVLNEPLPDDEVDIRPDDGMIYASHEYYRRQLNRAFGRMGWTLVPGSPLTQRPGTNEWYQRWVLFVGGVYAAEAFESYDYQPNNARMDLSDVAEAIKSGALKRCCKDLGVATECWNKRFQQRWRNEHAVQVVAKVFRRGQEVNANVWRRKDADKLPGEQQRSSGPSSPTTARQSQGNDDRNPASPPAAPVSQPTKAAAPSPKPAPKPTPAAAASAPKPAPAAKPVTMVPDPKPAQTPRLLDSQIRLLFARGRNAGLIVGEDATPMIEYLGEFGIAVVTSDGKTSAENCNATMKNVPPNQFTTLVKKLDELAKAAKPADSGDAEKI